jgi:hypothetical protein
MYKPKDRQIYEFNDGTTDRVVDPIEVATKLNAVAEIDIDKGQEILQAFSKQTISDKPTDFERQQTKEALDVSAQMADAIRKAFDIPPFAKIDGKIVGLTQTELLTLLADFSDFLDQIKKKQEQQATSQQSTEVVHSEPSTMKPMSVSGLTEAERLSVVV